MLSFLNNSLLENKTYGLNTEQDCYPVNFTHPVIQDAIDLIKARIVSIQDSPNEPRYINVSKFNIKINGELLVEIVWD